MDTPAIAENYFPMRHVVVVAMVDSIHTARWLSQFANQDLSIVLFPSTPHRRVHPEIKALLENSNQMRISIAPMMNVLSLPLWLVDKCLPLRIRSRLLQRLIDNENQWCFMRWRLRTPAISLPRRFHILVFYRRCFSRFGVVIYSGSSSLHATEKKSSIY